MVLPIQLNVSLDGYIVDDMCNIRSSANHCSSHRDISVRTLSFRPIERISLVFVLRTISKAPNNGIIKSSYQRYQIVLVTYLSLGFLSVFSRYKEFYVSAKLARRTDSLTVHWKFSVRLFRFTVGGYLFAFISRFVSRISFCRSSMRSFSCSCVGSMSFMRTLL